MALMMLIPLAVVFASCSDSEAGDGPRTGEYRIPFKLNVEDAEGNVSSAKASRATASNDFEQSVGYIGFMYDNWNPGNPIAPNMMWNDMIAPVSQYNWSSSGSYTPFDSLEYGKDYRMYFYYPVIDYEDPDRYWGYNITDNNYLGEPRLTYRVPTNIEDQVDVRTGGPSMGKVHDIFSIPTQATMRHALTAIRFVNGGLQRGTLDSVYFDNVYAYGELEMNENPQWEEMDSLKTFKAEYGVKLNAANKGKVISDQVFLMMPQPLPDDASMTIVFNDGNQHVRIKAHIGGYKWLTGHLVTYTLNITSLQQFYVTASIVDWNQGIDASGSASDGNSIYNDVNIVDWIDAGTTEGSTTDGDAIRNDYSEIINWTNKDYEADGDSIKESNNNK